MQNFNLLDHTMRLSKALLETELKGIRIDTAYANQLNAELTVALDNLYKEMNELVAFNIDSVETELWLKEINKRKSAKGKSNVNKPSFNWGSTDHLRRLLFDSLRIQSAKKTRKGAASTRAGDLEESMGQHPIIEKIVQANKLRMYKGTFVEGVLERAIDGRIYPEFKEIGTTTGRISHVNPNMGNIPAKDPEWSKIRGIFLPDEDEVICKADYSQIEICIAAHYSQDKNLLKIVNEGISQHDITAQGVGIERSRAKTLNFALAYGAGVYKVKDILDCSEREAQLALDKYWETYPGLARLIKECHKKVDDGVPIISLFGRKRRFETRRRKPWDKDYRRAFNALIQGTGSDLTSHSFYTTVDIIKKNEFGRSGFTCHDEIDVFIKTQYSDSVCDIMSKVMVDAGKVFNLTVPLAVVTEGGLTKWAK